MAEPITLAVVGTIALTEGIKFLYNQAGELLKHWRARRDDAANPAAQSEKIQPTDVRLPLAFEGQLVEPKIHLEALEQLADDLRDTRKELSDYADGIEPVDNKNETLLAKTDALRRLLEAVYQQRITFKGEKRPSSGPLVEGHIDVKQVAGYASAVRAKKIASGTVIADAKAERVEPGGQFIGVDVDSVGE